MNYTKNAKTEFVQRTAIMLKEIDKNYKYDVTLLINLSLGIISCIREHGYYKFSTTNTNLSRYCNTKKEIQDLSDRNILRLIRNGLAHGNIHVATGSQKDSEIEYVKINDFEFSIENLRKFTIEIVEIYLNNTTK